MMLHKYIPVESKKQGYYYGSVASDIICDTIKYCSTAPDFPESYIVVPNWYSSTSTSAAVTSNAAFELMKPTINNDASTFTIKVVCKELNYSSNAYTATNFYNTTIYLKWKSINAPITKFQYGYVVCEVHLYYCDTSGTPQDRNLRTGYIPFASKAEYDAAICLTASERSMFDLSEEKYTLLVPNSLCLLSSELPSTQSAEEGVIYLTPNESSTAFRQYVWNGTEYKYLGETDHKVDLSGYLKSTDISEWAKQSDKPTYTASEVGLGNVDNTADTDKPISTATQTALDSKDYLKATEITGQTIDLNDIVLNTASDKGKSRRYFCASASAQNISNRPVSANEPFELTVDNIRYVNASAFNSIQRYTSATRKRSYTRWCDDNVWRAWMCDTDIVIYGTVTAELPKSFDYATYGEGYNQVEIEPYYDSNTNPIRNRIVLTLTSATSYDRDVLTVGDSVEHLKIENGTVTMSLTGTKTLSFMIKYTNKRA